MKQLQKYKLKDVATFEISGVDKKTKDGQKIVRLCNFVDVYKNWAITRQLSDNFMTASASDSEISRLSLKKGQVAITKDSETRNDIGMAAYIADDFVDVVLGYHCALITPNPELLDGAYLNAFMHSKYIQTYFENNATGSGMRYSLAVQTIEDIPLLLPDLPTQKRIASVLSNIDRKIALNRAMNEELEQTARDLYDYWFLQFDFPDANGNPYRSSGGKMVYNDVLKREIPQGWEVGKLEQLANITMGQSPAGFSYNERGEGMIFYQGSTDFGARFPSIRMFTTEPSRFAKKGDILMSVRAPVGTLNIANTDCCIGRGLAALNSKLGSMTHLFYVLLDLKTAFDARNVAGTTFGSITKDDLHNLSVLLPQKEIVANFETICSSMYDEQMKMEEATNSLRSLRDELLPLLMNGQVTITE